MAPRLTSEKDGSYLTWSASNNYSIRTGAFPRQIAALCPAVSLASTWWEQKWQVSQNKIEWISKVPEVFCGVSFCLEGEHVIQPVMRWTPHFIMHTEVPSGWEFKFDETSTTATPAIADVRLSFGASKSPSSFHLKATTAPPGGLCWSRSWYGALGISFEHLWTTSKKVWWKVL